MDELTLERQTKLGKRGKGVKRVHPHQELVALTASRATEEARLAGRPALERNLRGEVDAGVRGHGQDRRPRAETLMFADLERCARCHKRYPAPLGHRCLLDSFTAQRAWDFERGFHAWLATNEGRFAEYLARRQRWA